MSRHDDRIVTWAIGKGANLAKAENKKGGWSTVRKMLRTTLRTGERYKEYMKLSRDEQLRLKSTNGWISGAQCDGDWRNLRNVRPRDLMTLDLDYPQATFWDIHSMEYHWVSQFESITITTRSHSPDAQRYRMVLPMARLVTPDEYGPLVRIVALRIEDGEQPMKQVDKVSARRAQMMFLPTTSKDGEFKVLETEGNLLDPDEMFAWFEENHGDWRDIANLPLFDGEDGLRKHADKAEDPWLKPGMIGNWCRAWPIEDAIAEFLSEVYVPGDTGSGKPRYTFTGGSASNGAVVEDDGRFLYSHHGTDPVGEQLVNAWDLIRIHKFGMMDDAKEMDKSVGQRASTKAMQEFVKTDKRYMDKVVESRYDMSAMFDDADVGEADEEEDLETGTADDPEPEYTETEDQGFGDDDLPPGDEPTGSAEAADRPKTKSRKKAANPNAKTWFGDELEIDQNGNIKSNVHNVAAILFNDPRFYGKIRFDLFSGMVRLFDDIKSKTANVPDLLVTDKEYGDRWQDIGHLTVRAILATPNGAGKVGYGLGTVAERDIAGAVTLCALRNSYHPVKDFMEAEPWDGVPRAETLFIDYLGVPDTAYARETARLTLIASVARIYEPGHKFDFAPVLQGEQGLRKSTFIETLYGVRWFGEINCKLDEIQKIAETIGGKWGMEFPELAAFRRTDHNDAKQFMSAREDTVRMAYAREVSVIKRQTIFWGSTNDETYLKDPTGNRRWWPQIAAVNDINTPELDANRQQIWAEARALYVALREAHPDLLDLPLFLPKGSPAEIEAKRLQDGAREHGMVEAWVREIEAWLEQPARLQAFATHYGKDPSEFIESGVNPDDIWVRRTVFCAADAAELALGLDWPAKNDLHVKTLDRAIKMLTTWLPDRGGARYRRWGSVPKTWFSQVETTDADLARGFIFVSAPEATEAQFTDHGFTDEDLGPEFTDDPAAGLV